jgi:1-acyl-sn-glycerol-3-phosphate acyltransferase
VARERLVAMQDSAYTLRCFEENLRPIAEHYFGAQLISPENFPINQVGKRAIIFVCNHSGMGLSWDNIILDFLVYDRLRTAFGDAQRAIDLKPVRLVDPLFLSHGTVALFGIKDWWRRTGCVAATSANFEAAIRERRIVIVSPEGIAGIAKGPHRKYQLQRFSSSFLRMAHTYGALVVPVSIVNAEYLNPWNISLPGVNAVGRRLGFPFIPIGSGTLQALVPASYLKPRPAKLTYVLHRPAEFEGDIARTYLQLRAEAELFRQAHQVRLNADVLAYHGPYNKPARRQEPGLDKILRPHLWHELFLKTAGEPSWLAALYKLPVGYPVIAIARRLAFNSKSPVRK